MSVAFICDAVRISDRRFSSSSAHELRSVLFSFSIALLVKERLGCGYFRRHTHGIVHRRFVVLQEPRVQLFLRKVEHLAARLVVRDFLVRCEFVQHTFGHADIHARLLKSEDLLGRVNGIFQQSHTLQQTFHRFQLLENRFYGGQPFAQPLHECCSVLHKIHVKIRQWRVTSVMQRANGGQSYVM